MEKVCVSLYNQQMYFYKIDYVNVVMSVVIMCIPAPAASSVTPH